MLHKLYDWTLDKASRPAAEIWLAVIAFVESSVFLIPADILFVPMALARPSRAYRYGAPAKPILAFYGKLATFEQLRDSADKDAVLLMLVTSGLALLPPIKVVTILSGAAAINPWLFIASCILARGARFFALGWALGRYGEPIRHFIEHRLGMLAGAAAGAVIALYFAARH